MAERTPFTDPSGEPSPLALKVLVAPLRYVQGPDALLRMADQLEVLGIRNPLILASPSARKVVEPILADDFSKKGLAYGLTEFTGESTWEEIGRIREACLSGGHDAIVSCGGGKTIDAGRCAAAGSAVNVEKFPPERIPRIGANVACINCPTVAATDASTSSVSMVYGKDGTVEAALALPTNPTMVLVDTTVIARAPVRLFVAGMGDALATYFEADVSRKTGTPCIQSGAHSTLAAQALARLCLDIVLDYGTGAKKEIERGVPGPLMEAVIEANVLLSGLGFESGGLSAAHAVGLAFHHIEGRFETTMLHGELVAFGTLAQLVLEERKREDLDRVFGFCRAVGLPTTFAALSLPSIDEEDLERVAGIASKNPIIRSMPGATRSPDREGRFHDPKRIVHALRATDAFGRRSG